jgi:SET domain-containing protein
MGTIGTIQKRREKRGSCSYHGSLNRQCRVGSSPIHGVGVFAIRLIYAGERISPPPGWRGFNHSCDRNVRRRSRWQQMPTAMRDVQVGEELTVSYCEFDPDPDLWILKICNCEVCR